MPTILLTTLPMRDAEKRLGVDARTILRYVEQGVLKAKKHAGRWRISIASIEAYERSFL